MGSSDVLAMLSAIAAILAVVVGPVVAFLIARNQRISESRQNWLDSLRDELASLLAIQERVWQEVGSPKAPINRVSFHDAFQEISRRENRIQLLLNPDEPLHQELMQAINAYTCLWVTLIEVNRLDLVKTPPTHEQVLAADRKVVEVGQQVIKEVWTKVKGFR